jgi:hypothetical protein
MPEPKLYPQFSTFIGAACAKQFRTFPDLAEKLKMDVTDLMRQCNGKTLRARLWSKGWPENSISRSHIWISG